MIEIRKMNPGIRVFTSGNNLVEGNAMAQLKATARLDGIQAAVGLPDLHAGKGGPVGAAFLSRQYVYPHLIGNDIGCGMGFWKTSVKKQKVKLDKWVKKLAGLESPTDDRPRQDLESPLLGTIGGGNHFAELMMPERIENEGLFHGAGLDKACLYILVHSGSRGIGETVLRRHIDKYKAAGLLGDTVDGRGYMEAHDLAIKWARENRAEIAGNFAGILGGRCDLVLDRCHNRISRLETHDGLFWLHRKGTAPADGGMVVIPGSRGTLTYLVNPIGDQAANLYSLPHGAGRKWNRKSCKDRLKNRFTKSSLQQTKLGSRVICDNREMLFEEAPQAFKNIEKIIDELCIHGLIEIVATFRPLITYKTMRQS